jgi:hypothetical protein
MDTLGRGLRQVTHLNSRVCPKLGGPACFQNGIGYGFYRLIFGDPVTNAVVFESPCNLVGANQSGYQLFAVRPDGSGLRQLTDASGLTTNPGPQHPRRARRPVRVLGGLSLSPCA